MFYKFSKNINFYKKRSNWIWVINEDNILSLPKRFIKKFELENINQKELLINFKHLVLWRWVEKNYETTDKFIHDFDSIINKFNMSLTINEQKFINNIKEFIFTSWRPLKSIPTKFELLAKEEVKLFQPNVNLFYWNNFEAKLIGKYNIYYSNKRIIFVNDNKIVMSFNNNDITNIETQKIGVIIKVNNDDYLLRSSNKFLSYMMIVNMIPKLKTKDDKNINYYYKENILNSILRTFN